MKIAVTGAFSYSGKYITKRLLARDEEVITLTGHPNRPDPFGGKVKAYPLDFDEASMTAQPAGRGRIGQHLLGALRQRRKHAAARRGKHTQTGQRRKSRRRKEDCSHQHRKSIRRFASALLLGQSCERESRAWNPGLSYAILRPTVLVGREDILINNIAFLLRRFPFFFMPGDGSYGIQPVYVEDLADLAVEGVYSKDNYVIDAVGPDAYTFKEIGATDRRKDRRTATHHFCPAAVGVAGCAVPESLCG